MPPRILASGPKPCGGKKSYTNNISMRTVSGGKRTILQVT